VASVQCEYVEARGHSSIPTTQEVPPLKKFPPSPQVDLGSEMTRQEGEKEEGGERRGAGRRG